MQIISVNIGREQTQQVQGKPEVTGIYKLPSHQPVQVTALGLQGDFVCDTKHHGGPDQAVYIYGQPDYDWWSQELGRELAPGTFGDNLTISALQSATFSVGDRLHIGAELILQVTSPRIPCGTLAARMAEPKFVKYFRQAERPGLYCRILQPGSVAPGDQVTLQSFDGPTISLVEMFRDYYESDKSEAMLRRQLGAPIAIRSRIDLQNKLQKLLELH